MTDAIRALREAVDQRLADLPYKKVSHDYQRAIVLWELHEILKALEATASASQSPAHLGNQLAGDSHE
jgi:hypothetical protein